MDVNVLRSLTTLLMFGVFIGIVFWALAGRRRAEFEAAAQLPFVDSVLPAAPGAAKQGEKK